MGNKENHVCNDISKVRGKSSYLQKLPFCAVLMVVGTDSELTRMNPEILDLIHGLEEAIPDS